LKDLSEHAVVAGIKADAFTQCLSEGKFRARVQADLLAGASLNVEATPTFFFGYPDPSDPQKVKAVRILTGAQPISAFSEVVDSLIAPTSK
jgi:predicted DsbA family dithiol-disulfide isomerase